MGEMESGERVLEERESEERENGERENGARRGVVYERVVGVSRETERGVFETGESVNGVVGVVE
jgi:hypothetical protein